MDTGIAQIKICGLVRESDIHCVNQYRPDYIGFVFSHSHRRIEPERAAVLAGLLDRSIKRVGVFVNEGISDIVRIAGLCGLDVIQLHGDETPEDIRELRKTAAGAEIWKAFRVRDDRTAGDMPGSVTTAQEDGFSPGPGSHAIARRCGITAVEHASDIPGGSTVTPRSSSLADVADWPADRVLLDSYCAGSYGGTGCFFNWKRAAQVLNVRGIILAGGLSVHNIVEAVREVKPFAVDVSSGVETDGYKDEVKIREFIKAVRGPIRRV